MMMVKREDNDILKRLQSEREGYIMKNDRNGVVIKCTPEFVDAWKARGFRIVAQTRIRLIEE